MNRLVVLGGLVYLIILIGVASLTGGVLALVMPLLLFLGAGLLFGPLDPQLTFVREILAERMEAGTPVTVMLTVKNEGKKLELVRIQDAPPSGLTLLDGETAVITQLAPGQSIQLQYTLSGKRGRYDFGSVRLLAMDFLGLLKWETAVDVPAPFELLLYPEVTRVNGRIPIRPRETKAYAGAIPARIGGAGIDFFGIRAYQKGDALRHINWRANARHPGAVFTNEFEQERVADVGIILDARQRTNVQIGGQSLFEHSILAAGTLAGAFLSDGNRVSLLSYGGLLDWTVPGYGKLQQERILQSLARAQLGDSMVFDKLEHLPARFFPPKSQIVLVSPLASDDADLLPRLRARGYQVLIISPDPIDFELSLLPENELVQMAARIARVERELLSRKLRQAGVQVVDWSVSTPLDHLLRSSPAAMRPFPIRNIGVGA